MCFPPFSEALFIPRFVVRLIPPFFLLSLHFTEAEDAFIFTCAFLHSRLSRKTRPIACTRRASSFFLCIKTVCTLYLCYVIWLSAPFFAGFSFLLLLPYDGEITSIIKKEEQPQRKRQEKKFSHNTRASFLIQLSLAFGHNFYNFYTSTGFELCSNKISFYLSTFILFLYFILHHPTSRTKCFGSVLDKVRLENEWRNFPSIRERKGKIGAELFGESSLWKLAEMRRERREERRTSTWQSLAKHKQT